MLHLIKLLVITIAETAFLVLITAISIAKLAFKVQRILLLHIGTADVLGPMAAVHAGIGPIIYFAYGAYLHQKRIAAEFKIVQRISNQFFLRRYGILPPLTLQIFNTRFLNVGIHGAGAKSRKQKAESSKANF